jgi:hypothetical protein
VDRGLTCQLNKKKNKKIKFGSSPPRDLARPRQRGQASSGEGREWPSAWQVWRLRPRRGCRSQGRAQRLWPRPAARRGSDLERHSSHGCSQRLACMAADGATSGSFPRRRAAAAYRSGGRRVMLTFFLYSHFLIS